MISRAALLAPLAAACGYHARPLPAPLSGVTIGCPTDTARETGRGLGRLYAGFAKTDITAPPGVSLAGSGPEGKEARGYRMRLYARVIVLDNPRGQRLVFIVADLPHVSVALQRFVAARILCATGVGSDRLIFSATHTHSAPGNFYETRQYNRAGSVVPGYDSLGTEWLASRIAEAVIRAAKAPAPARLAWSVTPVWGHTRNRSYDAWRLNLPKPVPPFPVPPGLDTLKQAVDPSWTMIRIDTLAADGTSYRPAGVVSVFAIHGTGNASENDLLDGDIHALVERRLERAMDAINDSLDRRDADSTAFRTRAVHLFANGTEGDVSPDWPPEGRCRVPTLRPAPNSGGPRSPHRWQWEHPPSEHVGRCLAVARAYVNQVGEDLGDSAVAIFRRLDDSGRIDVRVERAFMTMHLKDPKWFGLCDKPAVGTSTAAGADDAPTRFAHWRFAGFLDVGLEEGGGAVLKHPKGCQREKNGLLSVALGEHDLPEVAQLMVVRIGGLLLGALPAETTTEAGAQIRRAVAAVARPDTLHVTLLGLANGFMQYVATEQEYSAQTYEGGSTLYGPKSAAVLGSALAELARHLKEEQWQSPAERVDSVTMYPGASARIFPAPTEWPNPLPRHGEPKATCEGDTLVVRWRDARPGTLQPADSALLEIQDSASGWGHVAWDDDPQVEVRAVREYRKGADWEMRWATSGRSTWRVQLLPRRDRPYQYFSTTRPCGR
jgi:neutral ceramidase